MPLHVVIAVDQVPVNILDLIRGSDHLQAEGNIGNLAVVLGDADKPRRGQEPTALQQRLCKREAEIGVDGRAKSTERLVGSDAVVVESHRQVRAPVKALLVKEICCAGVLLDHGYAGERTGGWRIRVVNLQRARDDRVKAWHRRTYA